MNTTVDFAFGIAKGDKVHSIPPGVRTRLSATGFVAVAGLNSKE